MQFSTANSIKKIRPHKMWAVATNGAAWFNSSSSSNNNNNLRLF